MPTRFNGKKNKKYTLLVDERRSHLDRRSGDDRRIAYNLDYFISGGRERRKRKDRRMRSERRSDWKSVNKWYSVFVGDKKSRQRHSLRTQTEWFPFLKIRMEVISSPDTGFWMLDTRMKLTPKL